MPPTRKRSGGLLAAGLLLALGAGSSLSACGNAQQVTPVSDRSLQTLIKIDPDPVFWVGGNFHGLPLSVLARDPAGAYSMQYGTCRIGGQTTCVTPLQIVTTPAQSSNPGSSAHASSLRGVRITTAESGRAITIATGPVTVHIYARTPALAHAAAAWMVPVNRLGYPGGPLPAPEGSSGEAEEPLPGQLPKALRVSHGHLRIGPVREGPESEGGEEEGGEEEELLTE